MSMMDDEDMVVLLWGMKDAVALSSCVAANGIAASGSGGGCGGVGAGHVYMKLSVSYRYSLAMHLYTE